MVSLNLQLIPRPNLPENRSKWCHQANQKVVIRDFFASAGKIQPLNYSTIGRRPQPVRLDILSIQKMFLLQIDEHANVKTNLPTVFLHTLKLH